VGTPTWLEWLVENHRYVREHAAHPVFVLPAWSGSSRRLLESLFS